MNLTVREIPEEVVDKLRRSAKKARRSLNSEIIVQLENATRSTRKEKLDKLSSSANDPLFLKDCEGVMKDFNSVDLEGI